MTSALKHLPRRDLERLSAYLDHELTAKATAALEARLEREPTLRRGLAELTGTANLLRGLPQVRAPRNFTLTPEMAGQRAAGARYPLLQFATAFAALAFLVVVGFDALTSNRSIPLMAASSQETVAQEERQPAPEEPMLGVEGEGAAEVAPSTADEMGEMTAMPSPAATPTGVRRLQIEGAGKEATAPAAMAAAPPTSTPPATALAEPTTNAEVDSFRSVPEPDADLGARQPLLRWTELGLALAVIVLAAATYRRRPDRQ
jgi:hypothetical protein